MAAVKESCLEEMRASFLEVTGVLATIPTERLTEVGATEDWSVRDVLAHETGYERYVAAVLVGDLSGREPTVQDLYGRDDPPTPEVDASEDATNEWFVERARTMPVDAVLADFRGAHERLVEAVESCDERDLEDPARFPSLEGRSLVSVLPGQCWRHHREHLPHLQAVARRGAGEG